MTYRPATKSKANDLVEQLGGIAASDAPSEFAIRRVQRAADDLMHTDPTGAHTVLGGVAALRSDLSGVRRHHRIALDLEKSVVTHFNHSVSLALLGEAAGAFAAVSRALSLEPDQIWLLNYAVGAAMEAGRFREALDYCKRLGHLLPEEPSHPTSRPAQLALAALDEEAFTEGAVLEVVDLVGSIQRGRGIRGMPKVSTAVVQPDPLELHSFLYKRIVMAASASAVELNKELADQMIDRPDLMSDPGIRFMPMFIGAQHDGGNT